MLEHSRRFFFLAMIPAITVFLNKRSTILKAHLCKTESILTLKTN